MDFLEELTKEVSQYLDNPKISESQEEYKIAGTSHFTRFSIEIDIISKEIRLDVSDTARMAVAGGLDNYFNLEANLQKIAKDQGYSLKTPILPPRKDPNQLHFRFHHNME
ncbi:hypothetical protein HOC80_02795 [archaeon]|jgi:hypothetical protein|nr:hypothetical protein [archaeon]MBT4417009.1 hypothetical protein [archaeon]